MILSIFLSVRPVSLVWSGMFWVHLGWGGLIWHGVEAFGQGVALI